MEYLEKLSCGSLAGDYNDELDYRKRETINQVLLQLEAAGLIEVAWAKFLTGKQAEKVYLQPDAVDRAYALTGVAPKAERLERLLQVLAPLQNHPWGWVQAYWLTCLFWRTLFLNVFLVRGYLVIPNVSNKL